MVVGVIKIEDGNAAAVIPKVVAVVNVRVDQSESVAAGFQAGCPLNDLVELPSGDGFAFRDGLSDVSCVIQPGLAFLDTLGRLINPRGRVHLADQLTQSPVKIRVPVHRELHRSARRFGEHRHVERAVLEIESLRQVAIF